MRPSVHQGLKQGRMSMGPYSQYGKAHPPSTTLVVTNRFCGLSETVLLRLSRKNSQVGCCCFLPSTRNLPSRPSCISRDTTCQLISTHSAIRTIFKQFLGTSPVFQPFVIQSSSMTSPFFPPIWATFLPSTLLPAQK